MDAFCFRSVFNRLPEYVISNAVNELCEPLGAIRIIAVNSHSNNVYVDVKNWLHKGFEIRDRLIALRAKGRFDKAEIPQIPLKFGRYLLVLPSYTLAQHDAYMQEKAIQAVQAAPPLLQVQPVYWPWSPNPASLPLAWIQASVGWPQVEQEQEEIEAEDDVPDLDSASDSSPDTVALPPQPVEYESDEMPEIEFD